MQGGYSSEDSPFPIPNKEVKLSAPMVLRNSGRAGRCHTHSIIGGISTQLLLQISRLVLGTIIKPNFKRYCLMNISLNPMKVEISIDEIMSLILIIRCFCG